MSREQNQPVPDEETPLIRPAENREMRETMSSLAFWRLGAFFGAASIGLAAFGRHYLRKHVADQEHMESWSIAVQYQLIHSVALLVAHTHPLASSLLTSGILMFSGTIYALVLSPDQFKWMGPITPIGGLCFVGGWLALALPRRGRQGWF